MTASSADQTISDIDFKLQPAEQELAETLGLGCFGLVQVLGCACMILELDATEKVDLLVREYLEMMKAYAAASRFLRNQPAASNAE